MTTALEQGGRRRPEHSGASRPKLTPPAQRRNLGLWRYVATRPALYRVATRAAVAALGLWGRGRGAVPSLPFAGGWTQGRDLPLPDKTHMLPMEDPALVARLIDEAMGSVPDGLRGTRGSR